jgi:hypothetical protein
MILNWISRAKEEGATHIILVYDTEDKEEYPVFVGPGEDIEDKVKKIKLSVGKQEVREICKICSE